MIEPFRLREQSKDAAQAEAMRKECPWKITDEELSTFEEKVSQECIYRIGMVIDLFGLEVGC